MKGNAGFACVWAYEVKADATAAFEAAYGPGGDWVKLFSRSPCYQGTTLLRELYRNHRYTTVDYWTSEAERNAFQKEYRNAYDALDARCEALTIRESHVGDFQVVGSGPFHPPAQKPSNGGLVKARE